MKKFRKILFVPIDGGNNVEALTAANRFAAEHDEVLDILGTVAPPSRLQELIHDRSYFDDVQRSEIRSRREEIERWAAEAGCPQANVRIEVGQPALAALKRIHLECYELVVLPNRSPDVNHAIARRLLRKSPVPVWLVQPTLDPQISSVVAAIDPNPAEAELNREILAVAATFAPPGATVDVVTAWELYGEATLRTSAFWQARPGEVDQMLLDEEAGIKAAIEALLAQPETPEANWKIHVRRGDPSPTITRMVEELAADVIVIGTVARSGIGGLVMGNTAERVLDSVATSVVAVKPPGFISPVQFNEIANVPAAWPTGPV